MIYKFGAIAPMVRDFKTGSSYNFSQYVAVYLLDLQFQADQILI